MIEFDIKKELKKLPDTPGVYLMHDGHDDIIYIGKAINLKRRVSSYFRASANHSSKIKSMVSNVNRFEYIMTDSELEALILECNLIKENRPKYNTMLMDDKTYPYICVTLNEDYPRVVLARKMKKDGNKYYGPFTSGGAVRDTIELLQKLYKIRSCNKKIVDDTKLVSSDDIPKNNGRPCLYYHIGQCEGPCVHKVSAQSYSENINQAIHFLDGHYQEVIKELEEKMKKASAELNFEEAKDYRDLISSIYHVAGNQKITTHKFEDRDIIAYAYNEGEAVVQVFFVRNGKLIGRDHYYMKVDNPNVDLRSVAKTNEENEEALIINKDEKEIGKDILTNFIKQYYVGTPFIPHQLLVQEEIDEVDLVTEMLSRNLNYTVKIEHPKKGQKEKLVELARKNAENLLIQNKERFRREQKQTIGAVKEIATLIGCKDIKRIESYDISNISGTLSVGSMVVFEDGKPKKSHYRKFRIKTVTGPDDYASMKEVLTRRFRHGLESDDELDSFAQFPDLILMDGGKGQVNIALEVLEELGLNIMVCGMVKDDHHNTRGLYYNNNEIPIDTHSEGFKLITRIQDETHRFAIEYHRSLRSKKQVKSILDDIEGVGPARRKALLRSFGDVETIRDTSVSELQKVDGITENIAKNIYEFFHK